MKSMIFIDRTQTNPYFNIAAEEYVLKNISHNVFMLWINEPSVIIGKHQVAMAEANIIYTNGKNIPVIRRISGGGTVYHDKGNLNYSLIVKGKRGQLVDYKKYAGTIIRALSKFSITAELQGKSNLVIAGKKFSGNAEHVFHDRVLHHGTLLYNTCLDELRKCIRPAHNDYNDKSIRSVESNITNLKLHLPPHIDMDGLKGLIAQQVKEDYMDLENYQFSDHDIAEINRLTENKYTSNEWNFAYSPKYELKREIMLGNKMIRYEMSCDKGIIQYLAFYKNGEKVFSGLSKKLLNKLHHPAEIINVLKNESLSFGEMNIDARQLTESLF
ncbi:MAG: lipoate--protein ligase family protein [Bacteroidales bacterium]|nr:lipoate--protein ligase family protein [Bacteroidales bacterium]